MNPQESHGQRQHSPVKPYAKTHSRLIGTRPASPRRLINGVLLEGFNMTNKSPQYLKPAELCQALGISPRSLRNLQHRHNLPRIKTGKIVRYRLDEVESALQKAGVR